MARVAEYPHVMDEETEAKLKQAIDNYNKAKEDRDCIDAYMTELLEYIESYFGIDKNTDFEGKKRFEAGGSKVTVEYKINRSIDVEKAKEICEQNGYDLEKLVKVNYEYPSQKIKENLSQAEILLIESFTKKNRGKSSIEIK